MADPRMWVLPHYGIFLRARTPRSRRPDHSGLMLANLMTFAHFSVSAAIKAAKLWDEPGNGVAPRSASLALILESASAALTSRLSSSTMSCGVLRGAQSPHQPAAS